MGIFTLERAKADRGNRKADPRWHGMWAIETHAGRFARAINYHAHNEHHRRLALGWIVVPSSWRQGIMTEAVPRVISHCFTRLNAHRIEARIELENLVVTAAGCEAALHRGGPAARRALPRGRVPQRRDVLPAARRAELSSVQLTDAAGPERVNDH